MATRDSIDGPPRFVYRCPACREEFVAEVPLDSKGCPNCEEAVMVEVYE